RQRLEGPVDGRAVEVDEALADERPKRRANGAGDSGGRALDLNRLDREHRALPRDKVGAYAEHGQEQSDEDRAAAGQELHELGAQAPCPRRKRDDGSPRGQRSAGLLGHGETFAAAGRPPTPAPPRAARSPRAAAPRARAPLRTP